MSSGVLASSGHFSQHLKTRVFRFSRSSTIPWRTVRSWNTSKGRRRVAASPIPLECPGNLWEVPVTESLRKKIREPFAWHLITTYYNQNHNQNSDYLFQNRNRNCPNCQDSFLICFFNYSFWNQCFKKSGTLPAPSFLITRSVLVCLGGAEMGRLW